MLHIDKFSGKDLSLRDITFRYFRYCSDRLLLYKKPLQNSLVWNESLWPFPSAHVWPGSPAVPPGRLALWKRLTLSQSLGLRLDSPWLSEGLAELAVKTTCGFPPLTQHPGPLRPVGGWRIPLFLCLCFITYFAWVPHNTMVSGQPNFSTWQLAAVRCKGKP